MVARAWIIFLCLTIASAVITRLERTEPVPIRHSFESFPMRLDDWTGISQPPFDANVLRVLGVDDYLTRVYVNGDRAGVGLYVGYWASQRNGDTIHSPLNCLPGSGWEPSSKSFMRIAIDASRDIDVNRYVVQKGLDRQLVLYWYQSHGRNVASEYWSKFYLVADSVRLHRTDAAIVRITAPILTEDEGNERAAEHLAVDFARTLYPVLSTYLPQ